MPASDPKSGEGGDRLPDIVQPREKKAKPESKVPTLPKVQHVHVPLAGGIPIFEVIRKLEVEKIISKKERLLLVEQLQRPEKRGHIMRALQNIELSSNAKQALQQLKSLIHRRRPKTGDKLSANASNASLVETPRMKEYGNTHITGIENTKMAIKTVVGESPRYSGNEEKLCAKIRARLGDFIQLQGADKVRSTSFAVIVGTGSFNPITRMHLRTFFIAKQYIEFHSRMHVLGSLLSPAHPSLVRQRYRTCTSEIIPAPHRLAIAQLSVQDSMWLSIDPWEITRRCSMDYLSLCEHAASMMQSQFPGIDIRIIYLCKANALPTISLKALRAANFGCVCVCRAADYDSIPSSMRHDWVNTLWIAEDTAVLDASMDSVSSRKVREKARKNLPIDQLVGDVIGNYFRVNRIGNKMNGQEKWKKEEKYLPPIISGSAASP